MAYLILEWNQERYLSICFWLAFYIFVATFVAMLMIKDNGPTYESIFVDFYDIFINLSGSSLLTSKWVKKDN
jgi:hypothetical protein